MRHNPLPLRQARLDRRRADRTGDLLLRPCDPGWKPLHESLTPRDQARLEAWSRRTGVRVRLCNFEFSLTLPGETVHRVYPRDAVVDLLGDVGRSEARRQASKAARRRAWRAGRDGEVAPGACV